jgi:C-terminal processing protease CtpA/Prc
MAELLAAAIQEQGVGPVIGTRTAGSVAGSVVVPLSDGSAVQITVLRIDTGMGRVLNSVGLQPDIEVRPAPPGSSTIDAPLAAAVTHLQQRIPVAAAAEALLEEGDDAEDSDVGDQDLPDAA